MQNFIGIGRLTKDPVLTYGSQAKCTFFLAVETKVGNYEKVDYVPCVAWRETAELIANYVVKGQQVAIEAYFRSNLYEVDSKQKISYEFEVYKCKFL